MSGFFFQKIQKTALIAAGRDDKIAIMAFLRAKRDMYIETGHFWIITSILPSQLKSSLLFKDFVIEQGGSLQNESNL